MNFKPDTIFTHKSSYITVKATLSHHDGSGWQEVELKLPFGTMMIPIKRFKEQFKEGRHFEPKMQRGEIGYMY
jgi:hypothetical protein